MYIEPGEWHWHGATPTTTMTHLAIEPIPQAGAGSEAGEAVTDRGYHRAGNTGSAREIPPVTRSVLLDQAPASGPARTPGM